MTDTSRRAWTLTAVAVRIARAMGLHHESVPRSAFDTELRRRLWHQIRFLDLFSSLDRGTELLIGIGSYDTPVPKDINDSELDPSSTSIREHEKELTDMSFALMAYDATTHTHRLTIPESKPNGDTWQQRLESAQKFNEAIHEKYLKYCDTSDPFQRLIYGIGNSMINSMILRAVRPMQKHVSSVPPRVDSVYVLKLAMNSIKASEAAQNDPETQQWRWMMWVQWHALAVALAGLCAIRDTELANEAWIYADQGYARCSRNIADARNGMLWRPIDKLYKKASAFRDHRETPGSSISPPEQISEQMQQQQLTMPPFGTTYPTPNHFDSPMPHQQIPQNIPGGMPAGGVPNSAMNVNFAGDNSMMSGMDLGNSDMSWMDFERIVEDMSNPADVGLGDMQWPPNVSDQQGWPCVLHQNLM